MEAIHQDSSIHSVYNTLKGVFVIVPIVAGLDKFTNILTDWSQYLNSTLLHMLPFSAGTFMMIVGVIEITAGVLVFLKPRIGGMVVAAWLTLIAVTLLIDWKFADVAVRDLVMAISAFSMAKLAGDYDHR
ncbi:hypothetical protein [Kaistella faecalis]|uniref:hypothetical protein n=1 Tax=Kaistella faecalis TaxID=2852098 RepID=UPI001C45D8A2|nr:hypothetical protein [Chryseobacterium faecale]UFK98805.1 hypothetical protein LL667_05495 [Chryseobacterium faecale]